MKFLAWDTSSKTGCIVAFEVPEEAKDTGQIILRSEWTINVDTTQSERVLYGIHQVLKSCGWTIEDIDCLGVGTGPGSYTGLRIGVTTARTLAHTLGKRLVAVSSLEALLRPAALWAQDQNPQTLVIAATDAAKGDWFVLRGQAGEVVKKGRTSPKVKETVIAPEKILQEVSKKLKTGRFSWLMVGEVADRYQETLAKLPVKRRVYFPFPHSGWIQGRYLAQTVWESFVRDEAQDPLSVLPQYMRASSAELQRLS